MDRIKEAANYISTKGFIWAYNRNILDLNMVISAILVTEYGTKKQSKEKSTNLYTICLDKQNKIFIDK